MVSLLSMLIITALVSSGWLSLSFALLVGVILSLMSFDGSFCWSVDMSFHFSSVSNLMVFLSCLLCFLAMISSWDNMNSFLFSFMVFVLGLILVLAFSTSSIISFYIFFEASLIPTLVLIIGWGYQPERLQAGSYMMMYTVSASLPLLVILLYQGYISGSVEYMAMSISSLSYSFSGVVLIFLLGAFLVKLPMYGVHLWLPKAHVEAPLAGSMILAGILLKLGGFGVYQMKLSFDLSCGPFILVVVSLSLWGGLLASLMCFRQMDVKSYVAYSSVGHMSLVISGLLLDSSWGIFGALITMVAHAFSSSAMFSLAYFSYKKSHTRNIAYMKGMLQAFPVISLWWFVYCCVNMACPPTLNLLGELSVVPVLFMGSGFFAMIMGLMVFLSASYNMYLYSSINHGSYLSYVYPGYSPKSSMLISLLSHLFPLLLILKSEIFI